MSKKLFLGSSASLAVLSSTLQAQIITGGSMGGKEGGMSPWVYVGVGVVVVVVIVMIVRGKKK